MTEDGEPIARMLRDMIGLRDSDSSTARLTHAARRLAAETGIALAQLHAHLVADPELRRRLVDHVTVQESRFFRDAEFFDMLRSRILPQCDDPVTIWSAGCAFGQEAWSLGMLLSEERRRDWRILATDVSSHALRRARSGHFTPRELRGLSSARRARFMTEDDPGFTAAPFLRERVTFAEHNLVLPFPPAQVATAQLVLLRNVLIYLEQAAIDRLFMALAQMLPAGAWVVLGSSEIVHAIEGFERIRVDGLYVYRVTRASVPVLTLPTVEAPAPLRRPGTPDLPSHESLRADGERYAAAGQPAAAVVCFRRLVYLDPHDPAAWLALALAFDAAQEPDAARRAYRATAAAFRRRPPQETPAGVAGYGIGEVRGLLAERLGGPEFVA